MKRSEMPLDSQANKPVGPQSYFDSLGGSLAPKDFSYGIVHDLDLPFIQPPFHVDLLPEQSACQSIDQASRI